MDRVLVTGGASGIGAATCELLSRRGVTAISADITSNGQGLQLDATSPGEWEMAIDRAWPLDGLVNCAGTRSKASLVDMSVDEFDRVLDVNLKGPFLGMRAFARKVRKCGGRGAVVNVASVAGMVAIPGQSHYVASKGGLMALTRVAAVELCELAIRVNAVAPGAVLTPMNADRMSDPEIRSTFERRIPQGRIGEAAEIAEAIAFLLGPESSYVTGATLVVDGGWTAA